jgi:hypothetical protein
MARLSLALMSALLLMGAPAASAASVPDRIEELQQELDSLTEDDLQAPIAEFARFEQCMYLVGVSEHGGRRNGYVYGRGRARRPALAFDLRGFGRPGCQFLAFPAEEPPSIECNEDAGEEDSDSD